MSTIAHTLPVLRLTSPSAIYAALQAYRQQQQTERKLRQLSDHLLEDIGLERADLESLPKSFNSQDVATNLQLATLR